MSRVTAAEQAYQLLRAGIVGGKYQFGERLGEVETSQALGISRTPLREALRRLRAEGLVEIIPRFGAQVASWTSRDVEEIYELRIRLEPYGAFRAATRIGAEQLGELAQMCRAEREAIAASDFEAIRHLNAEFHKLVMQASGSTRLVDITTPLISVQAMLRTFRHYEVGQMSAHLHDHQALVEVLTAGKPEWAEALMRSHLMGAMGRLMRDKEQAESAALGILGDR